MRRTHIEYKMEAPYTNLNRHILGLPSAKYLCDGAGGEVPCTSGSSLLSKVTFQYDETDSIQGADAPVQHDNTNYAAGFVTGRANLSSVKRYDVINTGQLTTNSVQYNTAGSVVKSTDAAGHFTQLTYTDAFAANGTGALDSELPVTLAYPTVVTDPDGFTVKARYNYQFGATTWKQTPRPNEITPQAGNENGPQQKVEYDSIGRLQKVINLVNNAYVRYVYGPNYVETWSTVNNVADEAHSLQAFDGHGRVIGNASNHPGSTGGFSGQLIVYDAMGRAIKQSNPTETAVTISGSPIQPYNWAAAGDDAAAGWIYTQQTYDWKGRPLVTTNTDLTTKIAGYAGCGCAGGEVVTLTDEGTIDAGVVKRRQEKVYSDVLGRAWKTEVLNWEGGSVYSTTVSVYDARDQVKRVKQYVGAAPPDASSTNEAASCPTGTCQETAMTFDGYARLKTKDVPEQQVDPNNPASTDHTTWDYFADDTIQKVTDARGASATYGYNNRHLVTSINYSVPPGSNIPTTPNVTFGYDAAGNRTSMTDGMGSATYSYNQLSQMISEVRTFTGLDTFTLGYDYNLAGELKTITDPFSATINYAYDSSARLSSVTGTSFGGVTTYASNPQYRAWGALKTLAYGNSKTLAVDYNNRLLPTSYEVPGVLKKSYQRNNDGSVQFTQDQLTTNSKFDRSYTYDHVGRVSTALTGQEARGGAATNDRPYNETLAYDAMNHLTSLTRMHWDRDDSSGSNTFVNNRNQWFGYDADGRTLMDDTGYYSYDAAGRAVTFGDGDPYSTNQQFTGDGLRAKTHATRYDEAINDWVTEKITYYVTSTVLGSQVVTELSEQGTKERTTVFAGGSELASQTVTSGNQSVQWHHYDSSSASYRGTDVTGQWSGGKEMDPLGANAGLVKPFTWDVPDRRGLPVAFPEIADMLTNTGGGCAFRGTPSSCHSASVDFWGSRIADLPGFGTNWGSFAALGEWEYAQRLAYTNARNGIVPRRREGMPRDAGPSFAQNPQNTPQQVLPPSKSISDLVRDRMKNPKCAKYLQQLLDKANELFGQGYPHANSMEELLQKIDKAGGFQLDAATYHTVSGDLFANGAKPGTVRLIPFITLGAPNRYHLRQRDDYYAGAGIHEPFHLARQGGYSDEQMARTAYDLAGETLPSIPKTGDLTEAYKWSQIFDRKLQDKCPPASK